MPALVGIITCPKNYERARAIQETWLPKSPVDTEFFDGQRLSCFDDYEHLSQKTVALCVRALEKNYDRLLKLDDDSYLNYRAFKVVEADYAGIRNPGGYASGGAYWLSQRAMEIVARCGIDDIAEDRGVGNLLARHNIHLVELPDYIWQGFGLAVGEAAASACPCSECKKKNGKPVWEYFPNAAVITQLGPDQMRACHKFYEDSSSGLHV